MSLPALPPQQNHYQIAQAVHSTVKDLQTNTKTSSSGQVNRNQAPTQASQMAPKAGFAPDAAIVSVNLPQDWDYDRAFDNPLKIASPFEAKEYSPRGLKEVVMVFAVFGDTSEQGEKALHNLLSNYELNSPLRGLNWTEIYSLRDTIMDAGDDSIFKLKHIVVTTLQGVPIIMVEGTYRHSGISILEIVVDSDGKGRPEFLYFQAPEFPNAPSPHASQNLYARYRPLALEAFQTIRWRKGYAEKYAAAAAAAAAMKAKVDDDSNNDASE